MQEEHKKEMIKTLEHHLPFCHTASVIVFGHCNAAQEMVEYLQNRGIVPTCYLDNNPEKQGKVLDGIPVFSPDKIQDYGKENSIVFIITKFYWSMAHQLRSLGYEGNLVEVVEYATFQAFSTDDVTFLQKKQRVFLGYERLQQIRSQWEGDFLVVCPFSALGDVYWAMSYLPAYCQREEIPSCTIAVVGKGGGQVVSMFGYKHIVLLEQKEMDALVQALLLTQDKNAIIAHHDRVYTDPSLKMLQHQYIQFQAFYRDVVYGLSPETKPELPKETEPLTEESKGKIVPGKTVILAPYAHSIVEVPLAFWENLVLDYEKKGFSLLTNVAPGQVPLVGTEGLSLPLNQMISAVEYAGHFVGMRSGLCDVLYGAQCVKTVVFPSCYFSGTSHLVSDFFSLDGWDTVVIPEKN